MKIIKNNKKALGLLLLGITFIVIGILSKEIETIFRKAINICLECIGLG